MVMEVNECRVLDRKRQTVRVKDSAGRLKIIRPLQLQNFAVRCDGPLILENGVVSRIWDAISDGIRDGESFVRRRSQISLSQRNSGPITCT